MNSTFTTLLAAGITYAAMRGTAAAQERIAKALPFGIGNNNMAPAAVGGLVALAAQFAIPNSALRLGLQIGAIVAAIQAMRGHPISGGPNALDNADSYFTMPTQGWGWGRPA